MFESILSESTTGLSVVSALVLLLASVICGLIIALAAYLTGRCSKSFLISLVALPAIVQSIIMMVNGNLGVGVAVMGAFSLVRFRSVPGEAKEICLIFLAMAVGLCNGVGYVGYALFSTVLICGVIWLLSRIRLEEFHPQERTLKITVPEDLDTTGAFDEVLEKYTTRASLDSIRTSNLGSLFTLSYTVLLKDKDHEREMIDELRCRNGNLAIVCCKAAPKQEEL